MLEGAIFKNGWITLSALVGVWEDGRQAVVVVGDSLTGEWNNSDDDDRGETVVQTGDVEEGNSGGETPVPT